MDESVMAAAMAIQSSNSLQVISEIAEKFAQRHEVDKFAVAYVKQDGMEATEFVPLSNISTEFLAHYAERDYFLLDPLAQYCLRTTTPFIWEETLALRDQTPIVRRIYSEAAEFGMPNGMTMPVRGFEGLRGSVTFAGERSKFGAKEKVELEILGLVLHARVGELCHDIMTRAQTLRLTEREQETLRWAALGKTSDDIADILGLTKRTVDQHFENAARKLGTVNRVQTVVKAFRHNLITL
ncbi:LuxR family transcriptional regulator [Youhaiella tibetensis]|uniref:LuxR family transcriptional regulator n=1 Tax=Paradevosia tibetensis TaxID=1447062 RepID=A0A5B9DJF7_9HYPH|nr:LuxR family transcriptional regulator [Youhaiella tibetensis]QEE19380.1 LuxR family transcriptional regulator [Youhaiella tibetensis]GGF33694.1 LuxR family transcriptional regulator [Youhaiella tibetensis]